jgi:hypothetical protein
VVYAQWNTADYWHVVYAQWNAADYWRVIYTQWSTADSCVEHSPATDSDARMAATLSRPERSGYSDCWQWTRCVYVTMVHIREVCSSRTLDECRTIENLFLRQDLRIDWEKPPQSNMAEFLRN